MNRHFSSTLRNAGAALLIVALFFGFTAAASAQAFSSGSNGSDGAFDLTGTASGTTVTFMPSNFPGNQHSLGIYNFTYITIPSGVTVRLSALNMNGPVYWLASGNVSIVGTIDLYGRAGNGCSLNIGSRVRQTDAGAGGFPGGTGANGISGSSGSPGDGPGGGNGSTAYGSGGSNTGTSTLIPLIGGSGGGGSGPNGNPLQYGSGGGSGGGAILIASSTSITLTSPGVIGVAGGAGGSGCYSGGNGAGGSVRLVSNTIAGNGAVNAGTGIVRLEATSISTLSVTGTASAGTPGNLVLPTQAQPTISVTSVNSVALPSPPTASTTVPDASINSTTAVTITVQASNIPVGTVVTLHLYSNNSAADQTITTTPLAGTLASSTATATATFPTGISMNYVKATWTGPY